MKRQFSFVLLTFVFLCVTVSAQMVDMAIDSAKIERVSQDRFCITIYGQAPTPGWQIAIFPAGYREAPVNWSMAVKGTAPDGMVIQVITPYTYSEEFRVPPATRTIQLKGSNQSISLDIPAEKNSVQEAIAIDSARIERVIANKFKVTVSGQAPTPGWKIQISDPQSNQDNPQMQVLGTSPEGMVIQMITPYTHSQEFYFTEGMHKITIVGANQNIILDLPWPKVEEPEIQTIPVAEMNIMGEEAEPAAAYPGGLFVVLGVFPTGFSLEQSPEHSEYFECLSFFSYSEAVGAVHFGYVCRMHHDIRVRSFPFVVSGLDYTGSPVSCEAQISVTR